MRPLRVPRSVDCASACRTTPETPKRGPYPGRLRRKGLPTERITTCVTPPRQRAAYVWTRVAPLVSHETIRR